MKGARPGRPVLAQHVPGSIRMLVLEKFRPHIEKACDAVIEIAQDPYQAAGSDEGAKLLGQKMKAIAFIIDTAIDCDERGLEMTEQRMEVVHTAGEILSARQELEARRARGPLRLS